MIHYHGGPITPNIAAIKTWTAHHAMISFANPQQIELAAEVCQSFSLDNGAYPIWRVGNGLIDIPQYISWVQYWHKHPGFDWCLIPDKIDGTEQENDDLITSWPLPKFYSVPVWHLHESLEKAIRLASEFPRLAIGSSGEFHQPGIPKWWKRMEEVLALLCPDGQPLCRLHGLRQMDPSIFSHIPYASVDSTNVARNIGIDQRWKGTYLPSSKEVRALILRDRIEQHATAAMWTYCSVEGERNAELLG